MIQTIAKGGYLLDSGNRSRRGLVGRSPWTARDAVIPLPQAEAARAANQRNLSQVNTQLAKLPLILILGGAFLAGGQAPYQPKPTLSLSPAVIEARGTFGQSLVQSLTLSNQTPADFPFEMIANDVIVKDGKREFAPMGETPHSVAASAVFSESRGVVKANSVRQVEIRLTIPPETDVRAVVAIFHGITDLSGGENAVGITASLGTLITFQLGEPVKVEAGPLRVSPATSTSNTSASVWLRNPGNEPIVPEGVAAFLNEKGALVGKGKFPAQRLLPGERLEYVAEYPGSLAPGTYRVLCSFRYERQDFTTETTLNVP